MPSDAHANAPLRAGSDNDAGACKNEGADEREHELRNRLLKGFGPAPGEGDAAEITETNGDPTDGDQQDRDASNGHAQPPSRERRSPSDPLPGDGERARGERSRSPVREGRGGGKAKNSSREPGRSRSRERRGRHHRDRHDRDYHDSYRRPYSRGRDRGSLHGRYDDRDGGRYPRRASSPGRAPRHSRSPDRRRSPRRRPYSRESRSPSGRRRSYSRSSSHSPYRRRGPAPSYDKTAVKAALEAAKMGAGMGMGMMSAMGGMPGMPGMGMMMPGMAMGMMGMAPGMPCMATPSPALASTDTTLATAGSATGSVAEPQAQKDADGKTRARDFSFLVTEDKQDSGPNLTRLLGDSSEDSDSDSDSGEEGNEADNMTGFEAGSAIDQLLYRQKAVGGMEARRPGESADQFFKRKIAGMRMLNAEAGTSESKQFEQDVDVAIMNANTQWHWGMGDNDADFRDDDGDALLLTNEDPVSEALQLTYVPPEEQGRSAVALPQSGGALVTFDADKAAVGRKRLIIGSEGVREAAKLVPRAEKDALSNEKLRPLDSGRGLALLEKMGWKKGQGLGRTNTGTTVPVEAMIKTDMGGLKVDGEEGYRGGLATEMTADGPVLSDAAFSQSYASGLPGASVATAASMDSEFSSITSQTKSVQQINEENRRAAIGGVSLPPPVSSLPAPESAAPTPSAPTPATSSPAAAVPPPAAPPPRMPPPLHHPTPMAPPPAYPPAPHYPGAMPGYPPPYNPYGMPPPPAYQGYPPAYPPPHAYPGYPPMPPPWGWQ